ncbi:MAG: serine/threonine-protein kinase [Proteobacteria bacterium]|nr:serine/threonine-protein kinase [Pseudomonadota bacterium]
MPDPDSRIGRLVDERYKILIDDRYKILDAMASGSMGAVYKAERVPVGKLVAIKFLHASFANDGEFLIRFERETQVMSRLAHPNCVSVVDFGVWEAAPYLVMDFVDGRTLRAIIDDGPLPIPRALLLARQIAAGLAHAHTHQVVHRDVKPANIMVSDEIGSGERVRILDFGLARLRGGGGRDATQTNVVVGTPNYMAPEQTVAGGTVDVCTDIYAAGVTLYELIVGDKPFAAEETMQLLAKHRSAPIPRLAEHVAEGTELPAGLQEVIDTAMAKKPDDRYQTAIELADAIGAVLATYDSGGRPTGELRIPGSSAVRAQRPPVGADTASLAPTMPHIVPATSAGPRWKKPLLGAVILFGGIAAAAAYLIARGHDHPDADTIGQIAAIVPRDAIATPEDAGRNLPDAVIVELDAAPIDGAGTGSNAAAVDDNEIEIDPEKADDPNPDPDGHDAIDEATDAPKSTDDAAKRAPVVAEPLAKTIGEAVQQIKAGKRELALKSLEAMRSNNPKSAYIPFLIGNLYFDKTWWGVALDYYKVAIAKNAAYKKNPILNQNVITTLASTRTRRTAQSFLRFTVGGPAGPYLRYAAAHHKNDVVRKQAAALARVVR